MNLRSDVTLTGLRLADRPAADLLRCSANVALAVSLGTWIFNRRQLADEEIEQVEGYHIHVGGGFGPDAAIGRELVRDVRAQDAPAMVERLM